MWSFTLLNENQVEEYTKIDNKWAFQCQNEMVGARELKLAYSTDDSWRLISITWITSHTITLTHLGMELVTSQPQRQNPVFA